MSLISLKQIIEQLGEDNTQQLLQEFKCSRNADVQGFIHEKAIRFEQTARAKTFFLVNDEQALLAFYSLTFKQLSLQNFMISKSLIKRLDGFSKNATYINAYLIGQIAKNTAITPNPLTLKDILATIFEQLTMAQDIVGGRMVFVECHKDLIPLYEHHGFIHLPFTNETQDQDLETLVLGLGY